MTTPATPARPRLTELQREALTAAARHPEGLLPPMTGVRTVESLTRRGLVVAGDRVAAEVITDAGRAAVGAPVPTMAYPLDMTTSALHAVRDDAASSERDRREADAEIARRELHAEAPAEDNTVTVAQVEADAPGAPTDGPRLLSNGTRVTTSDGRTGTVVRGSLWTVNVAEGTDPGDRVVAMDGSGERLVWDRRFLTVVPDASTTPEDNDRALGLPDGFTRAHNAKVAALGTPAEAAVTAATLGTHTLRFETAPCGRCGGSGRFSFNPMDGDRCFGCGGTGKRLSAAGAKARKRYDAACAAMDVPADAVVVGDRVQYTRMSGAKVWRVVTDVRVQDKTDGDWFAGSLLHAGVPDDAVLTEHTVYLTPIDGPRFRHSPDAWERMTYGPADRFHTLRGSEHPAPYVLTTRRVTVSLTGNVAVCYSPGMTVRRYDADAAAAAWRAALSGRGAEIVAKAPAEAR